MLILITIIGILFLYFNQYVINSKIDDVEKRLIDFKSTFLNCYKHLSDDMTIINDNINSLNGNLNKLKDKEITTK